MPDLKTYDLFISHSWDYNEEYYSLEQRLKDYPNFMYRNYSVPEHDALNTKTNAQLEQALFNQIKPVNVVIVFGGMYVNYRRWIQKEIEIQSRIDHPNIVSLLYVKETNYTYDLIMEYASDGSLFHYIRKYKGLCRL